MSDDLASVNRRGLVPALGRSSTGDVLTNENGVPEWAAAGSIGTVTSITIAIAKDDTVTESGSPITTSGTSTLTAADAGADKIVFWDDSASKKVYLAIGTGLLITGTTLDATGAASLTEYRFSADSDTGFDNPSANVIQVVTAGGTRFDFSASASTITGSATTSGANGKDVTIQGGPGGSSQGLINGKAILKGGSSTGNTGGAAEVRGGDGVAGGGGSVAGGAATVQGGASDGSQAAGSVTVQGGTNSSTGTAGDVNLLGGVPTGNSGGNIVLSGANGVGTNKNGGSVNIKPGVATGSGQPGYVNLNASGSALATSAIGGFPLMATCAGTPTGTPGSIPTGTVPFVFDTTGVKLWIYTGGAWKGVVVA